MTSSGSLYFPVWEQMKATWHVQKKKKDFQLWQGGSVASEGLQVRYLDCAGDFGGSSSLGSSEGKQEA